MTRRVDDLTIASDDVRLPVGARLVALDEGSVIFAPAQGDAADVTVTPGAGGVVAVDSAGMVIPEVGVLRGASECKNYRVFF